MSADDLEAANANDPNFIGGRRVGGTVEVSKLMLTAQIGKLFAEVCRSLANQITTEIAQSRGNYRVRITAELVKVHEL